MIRVPAVANLLPKSAMNFIFLGKHKIQDTRAGKNMNRTVQRACSDILFKATLIVRIDAEQIRIKFRTNAIPTTSAAHFPPMMRKQSTQLRTVGYLRKNCNRTYAV